MDCRHTPHPTMIMRYLARVFPVMLSLLVLHGLMPATLHAQRLDWKLEDFQPLTELPWDDAGKKPLKEVLTTIFREPDVQIRYLTLAWYLRNIPEAQLVEAYDQCIILEGTNTPAKFIEFFLRIWAERDPAACWERTRSLFQLVGIEDGWLNYDGWKHRNKITVRDAKAIQNSRFWIDEAWCLLGFPKGVEGSSLPKEEKVKFLRAFADSWFTVFQSWPDLQSRGEPYPSWKSADLIAAFTTTPKLMRETSGNSGVPMSECAIEVGLRRWLKAEPVAAQEMLTKREELLKPIHAANRDSLPTGPPTEWLMIWRQVDLPAMTRWADSPKPNGKGYDMVIRGMLMSWVDENIRTRWLKEAEGESRSRMESLLRHWGAWNPRDAMRAALATKESFNVSAVAQSAAYGPFRPWNTCHPGLGFVRDFDVYGLCKDFETDIRDEWGDTIMVQWGRIDVGEAARYGVDFVVRSDLVPRGKLLQFFGGESDELADTGDALDRTFCALRVWAATKPSEMKAWVATLKDEKLRTALTWLAENPWGPGRF